MEQKVEETFIQHGYPAVHWRQIRVSNPREIRTRNRVVGPFPDGHSAVMLVVARPRQIGAAR